MPKPNRYDGNGKVLPNGTVSGRYVMRNGHWVERNPRVTMVGDSITWGDPLNMLARYDKDDQLSIRVLQGLAMGTVGAVALGLVSLAVWAIGSALGSW